MGAEDALKEIDEVHAAIVKALDTEGFLWQGASVRARDVLGSLSEGNLQHPASLFTPRTRGAHLFGAKQQQQQQHQGSSSGAPSGQKMGAGAGTGGGTGRMQVESS